LDRSWTRPTACSTRGGAAVAHIDKLSNNLALWIIYLAGGGDLMLTRRRLHIVTVALGAMILSRGALSEQGDMVMVRVRADEGVRAIIPPIVQGNLKIEPDQSEDSKELARRSPETRAAPFMLIIVGAIAVTELAQMIREMLRQVYYGGVVIDTRLQPPNVTSSLRNKPYAASALPLGCTSAV